MFKKIINTTSRMISLENSMSINSCGDDPLFRACMSRELNNPDACIIKITT